MVLHGRGMCCLFRTGCCFQSDGFCNFSKSLCLCVHSACLQLNYIGIFVTVFQRMQRH